VVEDQPANMLLARVALERAGYQVAGAANAEDARAVLRQSRPDLILMDIGLPGQDGLSLTRELKSDAHTVDIPIVALTAHAMITDRERVREAGCDGYMSKPFSPRQLVDMVTGVLQGAREPGAALDPSRDP
jgi:two-component system cell cycle response regulator DivK